MTQRRVFDVENAVPTEGFISLRTMPATIAMTMAAIVPYQNDFQADVIPFSPMPLTDLHYSAG